MSDVVLVVEDSEDYRDLLRRTLEAGGYRVVQATNGYEALEYLRTHPLPNLMVVDLHMPLMDGEELCAIRAGERDLEAIPVILYSNVCHVDRIARHLHANGSIAKTASSKTILAEVRRVLH